MTLQPCIEEVPCQQRGQWHNKCSPPNASISTSSNPRRCGGCGQDIGPGEGCTEFVLGSHRTNLSALGLNTVEAVAEWAERQPRLQATMRAGDVLFMSDRVLHCSGPNASDKVRRAWMPQFSSGPVVDASGAPVAVARDMAFNIGYHRRETAWREKMDATREERIAEREAEATRKMEAELRAKAKENAQPPAKEQPLRRQLIDELETVR